jgi:hypothetical protein
MPNGIGRPLWFSFSKIQRTWAPTRTLKWDVGVAGSAPICASNIATSCSRKGKRGDSSYYITDIDDAISVEDIRAATRTTATRPRRKQAEANNTEAKQTVSGVSLAESFLFGVIDDELSIPKAYFRISRSDDP